MELLVSENGKEISVKWVFCNLAKLERKKKKKNCRESVAILLFCFCLFVSAFHGGKNGKWELKGMCFFRE